MKKLIATSLFAAAVLASSVSFGNGLEEDHSWQFRDPNAKMVLLNARVVEEQMKNHGYGSSNSTTNVTITGNDKVVVGDEVNGTKNGYSFGDCINCATTDVTVNGNGNVVKDITTNQDAKGNSQSNSINYQSAKGNSQIGR